MIEVNFKKRLKTHQGKDILEINAAFQTREITQISGPSGAGKTTLLKVIAGLTQPTEGYVKYGDQYWFHSAQKISLPVQQRKIGFVFQDYALFPNMSVYEHLLYANKDENLAVRLMQQVDLEQHRNHRPHQLSGGQQQRLAILRALATHPDLLLMDEPFTALDKTTKNLLITFLEGYIKERQLTCLIVSHIPHEFPSSRMLELGE